MMAGLCTYLELVFETIIASMQLSRVSPCVHVVCMYVHRVCMQGCTRASKSVHDVSVFVNWPKLLVKSCQFDSISKGFFFFQFKASKRIN